MPILSKADKYIWLDYWMKYLLSLVNQMGKDENVLMTPSSESLCMCRVFVCVCGEGGGGVGGGGGNGMLLE